ncbi:MAG: TetR/AcrR family transcriptional regulator [Rhizobiaceae bacterium]
MSPREENIIEASIRLFMRYGVKRTSMNDIATEAGIARQTLYNAFSNKDAVLQATIRLMADRAIAGMEKGLKGKTNLGDQLDVVFKHIAIESFDLLDASPNSEDIVAGFNASSQNELAVAAKRNKAVLAQILEPYSEEIMTSGLTLDQFSDFVERSAHSAKYNAGSRKHLLSLLAALKIAVLKVTGAH